MKCSAFTAETVLIVIVAWCLFDALLEVRLGNDYTISYTLLGINAKHPILGLLLCYTLNALAVHVTMPQFQLPAQPVWHWVGVVLALLPVLLALGIIALSPDGMDGASDRVRKLFAHGERMYFALMAASGLIGMIAGRTLLAQHDP